MAKTVIAFDFGMRNIGVAAGQTLTRTAKELTPLKAKDGIPVWDDIEKIILEWKPNTLVVGQPLNMDGSEGEMEPAARKFANRLRERYQLPVELMDERLSSVEAKHEAIERGQRPDYNKHPVDSIAARLILESWMNSG